MNGAMIKSASLCVLAVMMTLLLSFRVLLSSCSCSSFSSSIGTGQQPDCCKNNLLRMRPAAKRKQKLELDSNYTATKNQQVPVKPNRPPTWGAKATMFRQYTSYAQVLGMAQDDEMNFTSSDDIHVSEDILPWNVRNKAANGKECKEYFVHHNYGDGFGHQMSDIAAAMVYHLLNREQWCFLGVVYYDGDNYQIGHGCKSCVGIYNTLSRQWPSIDSSFSNTTIHLFDSDRLWKGVTRAGGEQRYSYVPCPRCDHARMTVASLWVDVVRKIATEKRIPTLDIAIHIRKGDFPRAVSKKYSKVIDKVFGEVPIDVFTEHSDEATEFLTQLKRPHNIRIHEGGDAVEVWLTLAKARVLFVHESSFSISASIASEGIIFSQKQRPYEGRYDNHHFPCKLGDGWWVSTGLHGNITCDVGKLNTVFGGIIEKYKH